MCENRCYTLISIDNSLAMMTSILVSFFQSNPYLATLLTVSYLLTIKLLYTYFFCYFTVIFEALCFYRCRVLCFTCQLSLPSHESHSSCPACLSVISPSMGKQTLLPTCTGLTLMAFPFQWLHPIMARSIGV